MVTIGIPTYDRLRILNMMAESLYDSGIKSPHSIKVYDDCSDEYGVSELEKIFPTAVSITRNAYNMKADKNIHQMYHDFLSSSDDYFFNADSDLIFYPHWLETALELIQKTEGILSIFNANSHYPVKVLDETFCIKETIGSAGTLFTRKRVEELVLHFSNTDDFRSFDYRWSALFSARRIPIYCTNISLVQHIGYIGQNSGQESTYFFDFGKNFTITSISQGQIINNIFESFLDGLLEFHKKRQRAAELLENDLLYHLKGIVKIILKTLLPARVFIVIRELYRSVFITKKT
jgi:hypothetical protein